MNSHYYPGGRTRTRGMAAALMALVLSLVLAPAALAEPVEGGSSGTTTTRVEPAPGQEASDRSAYRAQQDAYLRFLEQKAAAVSDGEPAVETTAGDSGQPWLVGAGVVTAVAIASLGLAAVRTRRQTTVTTVTPVQRERDQVTA